MQTFSPPNAAVKDTICPECRGELTKGSEAFTCQCCGRNYGVSNGVPILLKEKPLIMLEAPPKDPELPLKLKLQFLKSLFSLKYPLATKTNFRRFRSLVKRNGVILLVGGGVHHRGWHIDLLGEELLSRSVNIEVERGCLVDVVADAHDIPFPDSYFDGIIAQSVLEHTRDNARIMSEMWRVLKPGGIVYVEVPFLQPVHMTSDFQRYTLEGLKNLFADFECVQCGVNAGTSSTWVSVNVNFLALLLSFNNGAIYRIWRIFFRALFAPLKFLDIFLARYSLASVTASENYFLGRKPGQSG